MYGGDEQGNRYVDIVLAPAAAAEGVTLKDQLALGATGAGSGAEHADRIIDRAATPALTPILGCGVGAGQSTVSGKSRDSTCWGTR